MPGALGERERTRGGECHSLVTITTLSVTITDVSQGMDWQGSDHSSTHRMPHRCA